MILDNDILKEVAARWLDEGDMGDSNAFTRPRLSLHPCDAISPALKAISDPESVNHLVSANPLTESVEAPQPMPDARIGPAQCR